MIDSALVNITAMLSISAINTPLEILKLRMMNNTELLQTGRIQRQYHSFRNCLKTIMADQGLAALWRGNFISLSRALPIESINYHSRKELQRYLPNTLLNNVFISIVSGVTASTLLYPTDIVRQLLNNNTAKDRIPIFTAFKEIKAKHGLPYFFKGYPSVLLSLATYRGCYNGTYDTHKIKAKNIKEKATIAYLCSIFAEYVVYPIEIVRKRRIAIDARQNFARYGSSIWKKEGIKGFYKGSAIVPFQSIGWAMSLILFDTAGKNPEPSFQI